MAAGIQPSDLELQILSLLWDAEKGLTARQVMESLPDRKKRAYTSVLSVMQVMEKKGLVAHRAQGNVYYYRAKVARIRVLGGVMKRLLERVFGGSCAAAVQSLLREGDLSAGELAEIRRLLDAQAGQTSDEEKKP